MQDMETLVQEHGRAIYGLCRKLATTREDADDLYQQTFLIALGKTFRADGNPRALLAKICVAQWKNEQRKLARRSRIAPPAELDAELLTGGDDPAKEYSQRQLYAAVRKIVANLDDRCRLPVYLYYAADLPLKEIARVLGCPEGTVKSRLSAARAAIKKELEVNGYDGPTIG